MNFGNLKKSIGKNPVGWFIGGIVALMLICGIIAGIKYWDWEDEPNHKLDKYYYNLKDVKSDTTVVEIDSIK